MVGVLDLHQAEMGIIITWLVVVDASKLQSS